MTQTGKVFDLEERTARFGESVISFCRMVRRDSVTTPLISQLVRSATSVGANYCEANNASSKKDFRNKIFICKKESQETKHWLRMLTHALPDTQSNLQKLAGECQQLLMIFQKICSSLGG
jgi:four helix bundle protein